MNDYQLGEQIVPIDVCGHLFHHQCLEQWILDMYRGDKSTNLPCQSTTSTIACGPTTCPICTKKPKV